MIVYYKLDLLIESKGMKKIDLQRKLGISPSTMANFSKNKYVAMSIIDKICKELQCQPGDIMEWVDDNCVEIASIEAQIAELQARKKELQGNQIHVHNNEAKLNDVVLTPSYVANLLVKLARVNKDSYVWDFATGSAGLLVAAMNEMLIDAKAKIKSPDELAIKSAEIKANQLLGLEILSSVYMLAILNMILMGDGSSNILNKDSLKDFNGNYGFGNTDKKFPADAFILNPPYSAAGNGMIFVEKALSMMSKGYAAIIIQNSTGSGKAVSYNKSILKHSTLLASIKMPADLFVGKSNVPTNIYVFRVGEAHQNDDIVKFIDFTNDGYTRTNRRKSSSNLRDTNNAKERYQEVVDLVRFGSQKRKLLSEREYYEGHIDIEKGDDWNQTAPVETRPSIDAFRNTVSDYLTAEISTILKTEKNEKSMDERLSSVEWKEFVLGCFMMEHI